jgi:hypothetical protein
MSAQKTAAAAAPTLFDLVDQCDRRPTDIAPLRELLRAIALRLGEIQRLAGSGPTENRRFAPLFAEVMEEMGSASNAMRAAPRDIRTVAAAVEEVMQAVMAIADRMLDLYEFKDRIERAGGIGETEDVVRLMK